MKRRPNRTNIHRYLVKDVDTDDILHSHAIRREGKKFGSVLPSVKLSSTPSQKNVPGYRDSMVGSLAQYKEKVPATPKGHDKKIEATADDHSGMIGNRPMSSQRKKDEKDKKKKDHSLERRHHFIEPPKRNFHRFS